MWERETHTLKERPHSNNGSVDVCVRLCVDEKHTNINNSLFLSLPVGPEGQLLEHSRRRVTYRCGREVGKVLGALADAKHHVGNQALAPAVGQPAVHRAVVGDEESARGARRRHCLYGQRRWKSAALEAAGSSTRGSGWAPSGPALPGSAELPGAARRALKRRKSRAGALPRGGAL